MNIYKGFFLFLLFMFFSIYAHSENNMDDKRPLTVSVAQVENSKESNLPISESAAKTEVAAVVTAGQETKSQEQIKAKTICIGDDCRSNWPRFKCASFDKRPAGETGDNFCRQTGKTCVAVSIGGGQSFFGECSVSPNAVHQTRCCWAE